MRPRLSIAVNLFKWRWANEAELPVVRIPGSIIDGLTGSHIFVEPDIEAIRAVFFQQVFLYPVHELTLMPFINFQPAFNWIMNIIYIKLLIYNQLILTDTNQYKFIP